MKNILSIIGALAILAALYFSGTISSYNITHPFWHNNATLYGGIAGAVLAWVLFVIAANKPKLSGLLMSLVNIVFVISLIVTLYFANRFVNAADYDAFAVQIWHKSSWATIISFIPQVAHLLRKMIFRG